MTSTDQRHIDYLVELAAKNVDSGIIEEPRIFFDRITAAFGGLATRGDPDAFVNRENWPVRITHATLAMSPDWEASPTSVSTDERQVQRVGLRFYFHDQYYMSKEFVACPLWGNKVSALPELISPAVASKTFDVPCILASRDTLRIEGRLRETPASARRVTVAVTGIGLLSKRPYFRASYRSVSNTSVFAFDTSDFRTDGSEPVAITDMVASVGPEANAVDGAGDIRLLELQVRQVGNGTGADWFQHGTLATSPTRLPCELLGVTGGRAVVHRFPGEGLLWEPGEGVIPEIIALDSSLYGGILGVALHGYLSVT